MTDQLSHLDTEGRARMVDVSAKPIQRRIARAQGRIRIAPQTAALIRDNQIKKGAVLSIAEIAGIQAAKRTPDLIPLCHNIHLCDVHVQATLEEESVLVESEAVAMDRTGVEMEALTAVNAALLTIYDMCKAVDKHMILFDIALTGKHKEPLPSE